MARTAHSLVVPGVPAVAAALVASLLVWVWIGRLGHPFDLEWMEGGMLAHAWRIQHGLPLYGPPSAEFVPFIYPPGYSALVAALGSVVGLSLPLGRGVSLLGSLAAAAALGFVVRRDGGPAWVVATVPVVFLGTYPQAGAFYDLVRPDGLGLGLMAWGIALALEPGTRRPAAGGLLLALAVLVKHNLGVVALPLTLALLVRGWRPALAFALAVAVPATLALSALQLGSGGHFLTYLIEVPLSHGTRPWGGLVDSTREWGTALPVALGGGGLWAVWVAVTRQRSVPPWAGAAAAVWAGMLAAWWLTYDTPPGRPSVLNGPAGVGAFGLGAGAAAVAVWAVGRSIDAVQGDRRLPGERLVAGLGLAAVTAALAYWMRAHDGGFVNVHAPFLWVACLGLGVGVGRGARRSEGAALLAAAAVTTQLTWSAMHLRPAELRPSPGDAAAGWRLVETLEGAGGAVLSPYASWLPVYAGGPPSLHVMAVWDVDHPGGPYHDDLAELDGAIREQRWEWVVGGTQGVRPLLPRYYEEAEPLFEDGDTALMPKTGWMARPERLLVPRDVPDL